MTKTHFTVPENRIIAAHVYPAYRQKTMPQIEAMEIILYAKVLGAEVYLDINSWLPSPCSLHGIEAIDFLKTKSSFQLVSAIIRGKSSPRNQMAFDMKLLSFEKQFTSPYEILFEIENAAYPLWRTLLGWLVNLPANMPLKAISASGTDNETFAIGCEYPALCMTYGILNDRNTHDYLAFDDSNLPHIITQEDSSYILYDILENGTIKENA